MAGEVRSQTSTLVQDGTCPKLSIKLPDRVPSHRETISLTIVDSSGSPVEKARVSWKVSAGRIVSGEGNATISFTAGRESAGTNIIVSASVEFSDGRCTIFLSDLFGIAMVPSGHPVDEIYDDDSANVIKAKLDNAFTVLADNNLVQAVFKMHFKPNTTRGNKSLRLEKILNAIRFRKYSLERVSFYFENDAQDNETEIWLTLPESDLSEMKMDRTKLVKGEVVNKQRSKILR